MQAAAAYVAKIVGTIVGSLGASAGAVSLAYQGAYYIAQAAFLAGINYGINALTRPRVDRQIGTETDLQIDPAYPRQMMVGRRAIAGSLGPKYSYGPSNWGASIIYVIADHPMTSLERVYADGRVIWGTPLVHGVRTEITAFNDGEAHMFMTWHDGRPGQTADAQLIAASVDDPDVVAGKIGAWTSAHKGAGVAYVHVELIFHPDLLVTPPRFLFECKGAPLYDRRLDTTAGGSGSHRLDDPSTWEYTDNAAVVLDHYLLGYQVEGDPKAFGRGLLPSEVPYATFAAAADLCDEDVTTGTGPAEAVIKRYRANGMIGAERYFEDIIEELSVQMVARTVDLGGTIGILGAEAKTPVVDLTDQDLVSDETIEYADKLSFADLVGAVEGQYVDPGQLWEATDYERQVSDDFTLADGGELDTLSLPLPFETNARRAARIARAVLNREMLQPRLVASFMPKAYELEVGDWFRYSDDYLGLSLAEFEVIDIIKHADFTVTLTARATDEDLVVFPVEDDPDLSVPPDFAPIDVILDVPTLTYLAGTLTAGGSTRPAVKMTVTDFDVLTREIHIEYRQWDGADLEDQGFTEVIRPDQTVIYLQKGLLPSQDYKIRVKAVAGIRASAWSAWSSVVTMSSTDEIATAGLADGFVGQDWGATASEEEIKQRRGLGLIKNAYFEKPFSGSAVPPDWTDWNVGAGTFVDRPTGEGKCYRDTGAIGTNTGILQTVSVVGGADYIMAAAVERASGSFNKVGLHISWRNGSNAQVGFEEIEFGTDANTAGDVSATPSGLNRWEKIVSAPATAVTAVFYCMTHWDFWGSLTEVSDVYWMEANLFPLELVRQLRADITAGNTAAGFVGQDWGATAPENLASNEYVPVGRNMVADVYFRRITDTSIWTKVNTTALASSLYQYTQPEDGLRQAIHAVTGTPASAGQVIGLYQSEVQSVACQTGDKFEASAWVGGYQLDFIDVYVFWINAAGSIFNSSLAERHGPPVTAGGGGLPNMVRIGGVVTAPALAKRAVWACYGYTKSGSLANPYLYVAHPMLARSNTAQTIISPFNPGMDGQPGADVTSGGTAAGFAGQGDLATQDLAAAYRYTRPTTGNISNAYVSKASIAVTSDGGPIKYSFRCNLEVTDPMIPLGSGYELNVTANVKRGSTLIATDVKVATWKFDGSGNLEVDKIRPVTLVDYDSPSAGTYTYSVELKASAGGSDSGLAACRMNSGGNLFELINPKGGANNVSTS